MDPVRGIAQAVLYEGYLLWPYRHSAMKNQQRFTFGTVHPPAFARRHGDADRSEIRLECLLDGDAGATADVELRFLHLMQRRPAVVRGGRLEEVDQLMVEEERHVPWEEATEREIILSGLALDELSTPRAIPVEIPADEHREQLGDAGAILRGWEPLDGCLEVAARELRPGLTRLTVDFRNTGDWEGEERGAALRRSFLSAHLVVRASGAELVSAIDPPPELTAEAEACSNVGVWPVLVGEDGARDTVLASPIILSDYPQVAPESPGDHFDGTEIDELLIRSILSLTDDEKREMRETDPRVREMLERTTALTPEQVRRLHGAVRELPQVEESGGELA